MIASITKFQDIYLLENLCAVLSNLGKGVSHISSYTASRLVQVFLQVSTQLLTLWTNSPPNHRLSAWEVIKRDMEEETEEKDGEWIFQADSHYLQVSMSSSSQSFVSANQMGDVLLGRIPFFLLAIKTLSNLIDASLHPKVIGDNLHLAYIALQMNSALKPPLSTPLFTRMNWGQSLLSISEILISEMASQEGGGASLSSAEKGLEFVNEILINKIALSYQVWFYTIVLCHPF